MWFSGQLYKHPRMQNVPRLADGSLQFRTRGTSQTKVRQPDPSGLASIATKRQLISLPHLQRSETRNHPTCELVQNQELSILYSEATTQSSVCHYRQPIQIVLGRGKARTPLPLDAFSRIFDIRGPAGLCCLPGTVLSRACALTGFELCAGIPTRITCRIQESAGART
jgi:hypothetical protein